jgi:hypothetical protein
VCRWRGLFQQTNLSVRPVSGNQHNGNIRPASEARERPKRSDGYVPL